MHSELLPVGSDPLEHHSFAIDIPIDEYSGEVEVTIFPLQIYKKSLTNFPLQKSPYKISPYNYDRLSEYQCAHTSNSSSSG